MIKTVEGKLSHFERFKTSLSPSLFTVDNNNNNSTPIALIEGFTNEINTELCFTNHLSGLVEKLNKRRTEQVISIAEWNFPNLTGFSHYFLVCKVGCE